MGWGSETQTEQEGGSVCRRETEASLLPSLL